MQHGVVVHYHEIGLKGRNRGFFERALVRNLLHATRGMARGEIETLPGRLLVHGGEGDARLAGRVASVFGVAYCAPAAVVGASMDDIVAAAVAAARSATFATFAVSARRATKELPFTSQDINVHVGSEIVTATAGRVDLGDPDLTVHVEVVGRRALVYTSKLQGPGGLPVGVSGRVVSLLSGGIDSVVATRRVLKRGARATLCHFHSHPFTDMAGARKARELARFVAEWQGDTDLYLVPFGDAQQRIVGACPPALRVVLYRRLMVRVATLLAAKCHAKALVTGDSLGQVASQTIENLSCVDDATELPVLRPLIGEDKQDIISEAKRLGTFDVSILPYTDCCSLFVPRSPATRASRDACRQAESALDLEQLAADTLHAAELVRVARDDGGEG